MSVVCLHKPVCLVTYLHVCVCLCVQDELMAELEELEQEELDNNLLEIVDDVPLPSVPSVALPGIICPRCYSIHITNIIYTITSLNVMFYRAFFFFFFSQEEGGRRGGRHGGPRSLGG